MRTHTSTTLLLLRLNQNLRKLLNLKQSTNPNLKNLNPLTITLLQHQLLSRELLNLYTDQNRSKKLHLSNTQPTFFQMESRLTISEVDTANLIMIMMVMLSSTSSTMAPLLMANRLSTNANQRQANADHSAQRQDMTQVQELLLSAGLKMLRDAHITLSQLPLF